MNEIDHKIQKEMKRFGYKARTVSITHLTEVQEAVGNLIKQGLVSKQLYERWHFYLKTNENLPEAKTIILVATPQPLTRVQFKWQGTTYTADIPPDYFAKAAHESRAEEILNNVLKTAGYKVAKAHLALKTLAVRSGLAEYGRNNITYIPGMGSLYMLVAFYTDWFSEKDNWQESKAMEACENCSLCLENCPTGSITADRFLIQAENCLGSLQEKRPDYPYWVKLQPDWHNALIGCMRCQFICPVNKPYLHKIIAGPAFSEEETNRILNKMPLEQLSLETRQKLDNPDAILYALLATNLSALIEKQRKVMQR
jgi:epoxyqueuosine reductase